MYNRERISTSDEDQGLHSSSQESERGSSAKVQQHLRDFSRAVRMTSACVPSCSGHSLHPIPLSDSSLHENYASSRTLSNKTYLRRVHINISDAQRFSDRRGYSLYQRCLQKSLERPGTRRTRPLCGPSCLFWMPREDFGRCSTSASYTVGSAIAG